MVQAGGKAVGNWCVQARGHQWAPSSREIIQVSFSIEVGNSDFYGILPVGKILGGIS